jgi:CII-binding regulator of phage lambda lysogenization HflD
MNLVFYWRRLLRLEKRIVNTNEILEHINAEISRLQQVKALLQGSTNGYSKSASAASSNGSAAPKVKVKGKRVLSVEARKKIAAAQRKRWAKVRKAQV